jgi:hypothetical protein
LAQDLSGIRVCCVIDIPARVNGEECVTSFDKRREIFQGVQVIGIGAPMQAPSCRLDGALCIIDQLLRGSPRPLILTDGLLGKDRRELRSAHGSNMTRCRKSSLSPKPKVGVRERCVSILIFNSEMNASTSRIEKNMNTPSKTGFFVIPILDKIGRGSLFDGV